MADNDLKVIVKAKELAVHTLSRGDMIRRMDDPELARYLYALTNSDFELKFCQNKPEYEALLDTDDGIPEENCMECLVEYLRQSAKGE